MAARLVPNGQQLTAVGENPLNDGPRRAVLIILGPTAATARPGVA
jgi:hypothetical protein